MQYPKDKAEEMLCKLLLHNKLISPEELEKYLHNTLSRENKTLPEYLELKKAIPITPLQKATRFVQQKGLKFPVTKGAEPISESPDESSTVMEIEDDEENESKQNKIDQFGYDTGEATEVYQEDESEASDDDGKFIKPTEPSTPSLIPSSVCKPTGPGKKILQLLALAKKQGASDLHISPNTAAFMRCHGDVIRLNEQELKPEETKVMLFDIIAPIQRQTLEQDLQLDFALALEDGSRYRSNIVKERTGWAGCFRIIDSKPPSFEELGLPEQVKTLTEYATGLILVTGPMGSGKTTTLAAMIDLINRKRKDHIITVEDPIEYRQHGINCQITQRTLGTHTLSYQNALKGALRQDPDIILVGELRDLETISIAITASETGHLVLASLHTNSADRTIDRLVGTFPPDQQSQIRSMVAESIRGVICQQLLPRADGKGSVMALEILMNNTSVRKMIIDNRTFQLDSAMQTGKKQGMLRMDDSIQDLLNKKLITPETAQRYLRNSSQS